MKEEKSRQEEKIYENGSDNTVLPYHTISRKRNEKWYVIEESTSLVETTNDLM